MKRQHSNSKKQFKLGVINRVKQPNEVILNIHTLPTTLNQSEQWTATNYGIIKRPESGVHLKYLTYNWIKNSQCSMWNEFSLWFSVSSSSLHHLFTPLISVHTDISEQKNHWFIHSPLCCWICLFSLTSDYLVIYAFFHACLYCVRIFNVLMMW